MTRTAHALAAIAVWMFAPSAQAQTPASEIRVTGEHRMVDGESVETARDLALIDARQKAHAAAIVRLRETPEISALALEAAHLEAFALVVVPIEEPASAAGPTRGAYRTPVSATVHPRAIAQRMVELRRDQDAAYELVDAWTHTQRLYQLLTEQTRRLVAAAADKTGRGGEGDTTARLARERQQTITAIKVKLLTARAYEAFARTVSATVGGRVSAPEGRERARQFAQAALALSADSPDAHHLIGDLWIETEQLVEAEAAYRKGLQADSQSAVGRTKLAAALRLQGRFADAIAELKEAQRLDPAYARAHSDHGMILKAEGQVSEAISAYRDAIRLDPDAVDARNGLAVALANRGNLEEAVVQFREIVRIDPDSTIGYYNLAYALADLDRDVESAAALREVIRIDPNHYNARYNLGELFRLEQKYDDSATQFREYLRLAPDTPQNRRNIARARGFIQQFEDPNAPPVPPARMNR
jgi:tetratricopeptide (TPR) repeat protein